MTTIQFLGSTADNVYAFNITEDGDTFPVAGRNETGNSSSLRFVLQPVVALPPNIRFWNSFRLTGSADGTLVTEWEGQVYRSRWNMLPMPDGSIVLTSTPQKTDVQIAAEAAEAATQGNAVNQALNQQAAANTAAANTSATTTTTSSGGIGIAALLIGAAAL